MLMHAIPFNLHEISVIHLGRIKSLCVLESINFRLQSKIFHDPGARLESHVAACLRLKSKFGHRLKF